MSKYKVGDRVVVISKEEAEKKRNVGFGFAYGMKEYCGKTVTIKRVDNDGTYKINEDKYANYWWSEEFFEGLEKDVHLKERPLGHRETIRASFCLIGEKATQEMINNFRIANESFKNTFINKKENKIMNKKDILAVRNYNDRAMVMQFDKKDKNGKNVQARAEVHDGDTFDLDEGIRICLLKYLLGGHKEYMAIMDAARKSYKKTVKADQEKAAEKYKKAIVPVEEANKKMEEKEKRDKEIEELIAKAIKKALAKTGENDDKSVEE